MTIDIESFLDPVTLAARSEEERRRAARPGPDDATFIDVADYLDADFYRRELDVFRRTWHLACTSAELAEVGQYMRWDFLGRPIIVTRSAVGTLSAFYGVCAHRGGPVGDLEAGSGATRRFVCPYHNWSYDLRGRLAGRPSPEHFPDSSNGDIRLPAVQVAEHAGLVWINESPDAAPLGSWLGTVGTSIERGDIARYSLESHRRYDVAANWKLSTEGGIDTYHIDYLHSRTARGVLDNAGTLVLKDGPHSTAIVPIRRPDLIGAYLPGGLGDRLPANVQCWVFPTHLVSLFPYAIALIAHYPAAIDRTVVDWRILISDEVTSAEARAEIVRNYEATFDEDRDLTPLIQRNLESGVLERAPLSVKEDRVLHIHQAMIEAIS